MQPEHRRYQMIAPIGRGGFGTVYRARMTSAGGFEKIVAIKFLDSDGAGAIDFSESLRDEARMLAMLSHRSIVGVHDLRLLDGRWAVVMEFVPGGYLWRLLSADPVAVGPVLEIVGEIADAISTAYEGPGPNGKPLRLLHRDRKPANIRLTPVGEVSPPRSGLGRRSGPRRIRNGARHDYRTRRQGGGRGVGEERRRGVGYRGFDGGLDSTT